MFENFLQGYLSAVAALKCDGSSFQCHALENKSAAASLHESICRKLRINPANYRLVDVPVRSGTLPDAFVHWIKNAHRCFQKDYTSNIGDRILDHLAEELQDEIGNATCWFSLCRDKYESDEFLGAIWDIYIVKNENSAYAIHCSWDD